MKIKKIKITILILLCATFGSFNFYVYANTASTNNNPALDSDDDGLTDAEENAYGTNLAKADTDGDGYSDGVEIKSGYDPLKPAPGDKIIATSQIAGATTDDSTNLTNTFSTAVDTYLAANTDKDVSVDDLQKIVSESLSQTETPTEITFDDLPEVDTSKIKILKQPYANLSAAEQKKRRTEDLNKYLLSAAYILAMNSPGLITTPEGAQAFVTDFQEKFTQAVQMNGDIAYFEDLASRLERVLAEVEKLEVPETALDLHVKILRLGRGYLAFRDMPRPSAEDPLAMMTMVAKFQNMNELAIPFVSNDLFEYLNTTDSMQTLLK